MTLHTELLGNVESDHDCREDVEAASKHFTSFLTQLTPSVGQPFCLRVV